jgi:hypothetical protein
MDRDPLNFFQPFEQLPAGHENQLTRALLVILRMSPMAHAVWLRQAAPDLQLQALPVASYETQRGAIHVASDAEEPAALISVFLTPKRPLEAGIVTESDRLQVLDAIIDYGGEQVVVVENKVAEAEDWQAREINFTGGRFKVDDGQEARVVLWPDLLAELTSLIDRGLVAGAEAGLINDFLTYTEDYFPGLGPYRTLALCKGNRYRQYRRLRAVLAEATDANAGLDYRGYPFIDLEVEVAAYVYLQVTDDAEAVELRFYPADTLSQARALYADPHRIDALRDLAKREGWSGVPNMHFGHMQRGYVHTASELGFEEYLTFWQREIGATGVVPREKWEPYWSWLEREGIVSAADKADFDRTFTETERGSATPRPGVRCTRRWSMVEAEELDSAGRLGEQVHEALTEARRALAL